MSAKCFSESQERYLCLDKYGWKTHLSPAINNKMYEPNLFKKGETDIVLFLEIDVTFRVGVEVDIRWVLI